MSTQSTTTERRVIKGESLKDPQSGQLTGRYAITFDDHVTAETDDAAIAKAARAALDQGRPVEVEIEKSPSGVMQILELRLLDPKPRREEPAPQAAPPAALARRPDLPQGLIESPTKLAEQMEAMAKHYNVLSPAIAVANMAPGYGANLAIVQIDATVEFNDKKTSGAGADTYWSKSIHQDPSKRSLNKQGLLKIANAAGIQWDRANCRRLDDGSQRNYWHWQYAGAIRTHDGQLQPVQGSRELDLRDGAAEATAMTPDQLKRARAFGNEICETKAMERAIRSLGVRQAYHVDELKKPFVVVRFSFTPDMSDPEIKKLVTERAISGMGQLYESPAPPVTSAPALPPPAVTEDPFATASPASTGSAPVSGAAAAAAASSSGPKWPADAKFIVEVKVKREGETNGRGWKLYEVAAKGGETWTTFSSSHLKDIEFAREKGWPVRIEAEERDPEKYPGQLTITAVAIIDPRQQDLPLDGQPKGGF